MKMRVCFFKEFSPLQYLITQRKKSPKGKSWLGKSLGYFPVLNKVINILITILYVLIDKKNKIVIALSLLMPILH